LTGRHGRSVPSGGDHEQAAIEAEATATATVIAGLRWRLRRQETLEHPKVLSELRKLEDQMAAQLDHAGRTPGRHRAVAGQVIGQQIGDASGFDLKPNPLTAATAGEFIQALREYKAWSGDPSWRTMAKRAGQRVVHSTMYAAMNGDSLPKFEVVTAIITGCGGGEDDLRAFATAWRRIESGRGRLPRPRADFLSAPPAPVLTVH
jgi:hypothetical protein